jgi:hypothetical protein
MNRAGVGVRPLRSRSAGKPGPFRSVARARLHRCFTPHSKSWRGRKDQAVRGCLPACLAAGKFILGVRDARQRTSSRNRHRPGTSRNARRVAATMACCAHARALAPGVGTARTLDADTLVLPTSHVERDRACVSTRMKNTRVAACVPVHGNAAADPGRSHVEEADVETSPQTQWLLGDDFTLQEKGSWDCRRLRRGGLSDTLQVSPSPSVNDGGDAFRAGPNGRRSR